MGDQIAGPEPGRYPDLLSGGYQPNDLMDQRDSLVDQLSQITRVEVHGGSGSDMIVSIGGQGGSVQGAPNRLQVVRCLRGPIR